MAWAFDPEKVVSPDVAAYLFGDRYSVSESANVNVTMADPRFIARDDPVVTYDKNVTNPLIRGRDTRTRR